MATKPSERPRAIPTLNGKTPQQICEELDFDPYIELIKLCKGKRTVRDKDGNACLDPNGKPEMVPLLEMRLQVEALKALIEFTRPKLRTQEVKEQIDVNFTVTINRFEDPKVIQAPTIELPE